MIIHVKVKPNASKDKIDKISENEYNAWVKAKPKDGKANQRLTNLLAKEFGVNVKQVKIKNPSSRKKIIEILDN